MRCLISSTLLGIALAAPVGPISLEMIKRGVRFGFFASLAIGLGGMTADALFMLLIYFGLTHFLTIEIVHILLFFFGSLFLLKLSIESINNTMKPIDTLNQNETPSNRILLNSYVIGFTIALINPINILFWFGIYGSVLSETAHNTSINAVFYQAVFIFLGIFLWNVCISTLSKLTSFVMNNRLYQYIHGFAALLLMYYSLHFGYECIQSIRLALA